MHNAALAALGLNWRYLAFDVHPDDLRTALDGARAMNFVGLNLTVPHKLLALHMVDHLDESARTWGAVNTVRFEAKDPAGVWQPLARFGNIRARPNRPDEPPGVHGSAGGFALPENISRHEVRASGFNTDADAIIQSLREDLGFEAAGASALLLGAGGAGRVAALRLAAANVKHLYLVNRTTAKAAAVGDEIRARFPTVGVTLGYPATVVDLVLNATSLGLKPEDDLPLREADFSLRNARAVYDMVYRPAETPLLALARASGCRAANGIGMLLYQGATALELWSGQRVPIEVMRNALIKNVYGRS
jgi:shikimate dehydrogenase